MPDTTTHPLADVPAVLFDDPAAEARWRARFDAVRIGLPDPARDAPDRTVLVSNESGIYELHTWDVDSGERVQATSRPDGTTSGVLTPDGTRLWWFDDADGDEFGSWRRQPFGTAGPAEDALPGVPPGYPAGLELGDAVVVAGFADDDGSRVHLTDGAGTRAVYTHAEDASVGALSRDETRWVLAHSEAGDSRYPELRVYAVADGAVLAELSDGPGKGLNPQAFSPVAGDQRLLVGHERRGRDELLIWDTVTGGVTELELDLPGDVDADFYPDATALLLSHTHTGRTTLHRYDLASGELTGLPAAPGTVGGAVARPDGAVWYRHSSAAAAASVRVLADGADAVLLTPPGGAAPGSEPLTDLWVDGPGGRIHAFTARPAGSTGPLPTLFYVHGGPAAADDDSFDATRATWLDAGFAVVQVNYRGSTGYGSAWRDALTERIGHTELADITAVHDRVVADGLTDPARSVLLGYSWGGFLTLLGVGTHPGRWAAAVAGAPVADYLAAYEDEMEPLRAYDRALFGGSPAEVPEKYRDSSPLTWLPSVRTPVLVSAGENDPRTPIRQVENYLDGLAAGGHRYEVYRYDAGHGSMVVAERMRQVAVELDFVRRVLADRA
ncbi:prolyl oligopeptidase family serine peptidase [Nakamurella deserti]|uniref:S9 family peptidase n=1 Tax=Nakamurella deserti TaxID=2164074 RepID=UPI000DBE1716|nr:prolyl oligopeptidase family serine peptidase [Nakamurella deserti]